MEFLQELLKNIDFAKLISDNLGKIIIGFFGGISTVAGGLWKVYIWNNKRKLEKDLFSHFTKLDVKKHTQYYGKAFQEIKQYCGDLPQIISLKHALYRNCCIDELKKCLL